MLVIAVNHRSRLLCISLTRSNECHYSTHFVELGIISTIGLVISGVISTIGLVISGVISTIGLVISGVISTIGLVISSTRITSVDGDDKPATIS
jgi:hypothetical protein